MNTATTAQFDLDFTRRPRRSAPVYFNTTGLRGDELASARHEAHGQDVLVLAILREHHAPMTPSDVWRAAAGAGSNLLLTSVRRSMNTLTRQALLRKLDATAPGPFGRPERQWEAR